MQSFFIFVMQYFWTWEYLSLATQETLASSSWQLIDNWLLFCSYPAIINLHSRWDSFIKLYLRVLIEVKILGSCLLRQRRAAEWGHYWDSGGLVWVFGRTQIQSLIPVCTRGLGRCVNRLTRLWLCGWWCQEAGAGGRKFENVASQFPTKKRKLNHYNYRLYAAQGLNIKTAGKTVVCYLRF